MYAGSWLGEQQVRMNLMCDWPISHWSLGGGEKTQGLQFVAGRKEGASKSQGSLLLDT